MRQKAEPKRKILFVGGGTLGSVSPLLAIKHDLKKKVEDVCFVWVGTKNGPEKELIDFKYYSLPEAKLRRYLDIKNVLLPILLIFSFIKSAVIIVKEKPDLIIGAGSYLEVPVIIASKLFGIKSLIHQQDIIPSLANKIAENSADAITVTFKESLNDFSLSKTTLTGNPVRKYLFENGWEEKNLILVMGGGTGSEFINNLTAQNINELVRLAEVAHVTGKNKAKKIDSDKYRQFKFIGDEIGYWLQRARIVICRAGLSTLTELAYLKKAAIVIPLPDSHQEHNAQYLREHNAAVVLREESTDSNTFVGEIKKLMKNESASRRMEIGENLNKLFNSLANEKMIKIIESLLYG